MDETQSFEKKVEKIKEILSQLNHDDLSLKEGVLLYKEGIGILQEAQKMLENAQIEYEEIKSQIKG
ncbi:exodeoxyribonuclease VII small subunit [Helicobacter sp. faydin-H20]|uniref:exodeoxyribonuclease VII small subunit n=1 Tax=Helicobacter anatolicus TaxID=2905874 RepID=UPI001E37E294|nr:exodeoxyribonuclease VII small subunit [Helicobacter anatolicus]MCE3036358.1 exodeoxyribonuclease VII small subunit [Helicobacter anatolicus]